MRAALYARVSTERQERFQTIDSQLAALRDWAATGGHEISDDFVFRDEGYSGSRLDRPGLDALRDAVRDGVVGIVAVLTPDRLARKYAYQVLLLEEFRRAGVEIVFLQHPISDDPNDQLLLQIQGAIAEYERAVLGERFRRGKLQKARDGHYQGGCAPYGYRYVPRQEAVPGHLVVDEKEAALVRTLYGWLIDERTTIRQILKGSVRARAKLEQSTTCCCYWQYDARISPEYLVSVACQSRGLARALTEPLGRLLLRSRRCETGEDD